MSTCKGAGHNQYYVTYTQHWNANYLSYEAGFVKPNIVVSFSSILRDSKDSVLNDAVKFVGKF